MADDSTEYEDRDGRTPEDEREIERRARESLEAMRPYLQIDGGDVKFVRYDHVDDWVYISFLGECADCSLRYMTLQAGIAALMRKEIPRIKRVELLREKTPPL
jgi:Fe-S cluster biogenesis protein NfuA